MDNDNSNEDTIAKGEARQMGPLGGNSDSSQPTRPTDSENGQMGTPPDMNCEEDSEECEVPELPEDFDGEIPEDIQGGGFGGGRGEFMTQNTNSNSDAILHPAAYLAIGGGSVILGILISYVCFSRCFHLRPGETFASKTKFIWFVVVAIMLAVGISVLGYFIPVWTQS